MLFAERQVGSRGFCVLFYDGKLKYGETEENYGNKKITGFFKDSGTTEM